MKQIKQITFIILAISISLTSCTVQKRVYTRGINIEWLKHNGSDQTGVVYTAKKAVKKNSFTSAQAEKTAIANNSKEDIFTEKTESTTIENIIPDKTPNLTANTQGKKSTIAPRITSLKGNKINKLISQNTNALSKPVIKAAAKKILGTNNVNEVAMVLIYILCIVLPPVAVGLVTDWDATPVISNILWCLLCGLPGIIHAFVVVGRES